MNEELLRRAQVLFEAALEVPPEERQALVARSSGDDRELSALVHGLLWKDATDQAFLSAPLARSPAPAETSGEVPRERIGRYQILGRIGHGGTSTVYLARDAELASRPEVAIKVVRQDAPPGDARLRAESRILESLDHPLIAGFLDAGTTPEGLPYFVMEYVEGEPITEYSTSHELSIRQRLELFVQVCEAVHFAHRNLIVHRDLKPGNILVDREGRPRLLDFGIAKLLAPGEVAAESTASAFRLLTPSYAAPEQFSGGRITTATDVYSLGVLLYELLTGRRPFAWHGLSPPEILERWRRREAPAPSEAVLGHAPEGRESGDTSSGARVRPTTTGRARALSGDLDNIVLCALRFEPERRYGSAQALAEDVRRYLSGQPVTARAPTFGYHLAKLLRRNAAASSMVAVGLLLLFALAGVATWKAVEAERQRAAAVAAQVRAQRVTELLTDIFYLADPFQEPTAAVTARQLLDRAADRLATLDEQPLVHAELEHALGTVYARLGAVEEGRTLLVRAAERRRRLGDERGLAESLLELGALLREAGELDAAQAANEEALATRTRPGPRDDALAATALRQVGDVAIERGDLDEAEDRITSALEVHRRLGTGREIAADLSSLTIVHLMRGEYPAAEAAGREALAASRAALGRGHPLNGDHLSNLAVVLRRLGKLEEAEGLHREALKVRRQALGPRHPVVANSLNNLARILIDRGRLAEAEGSLREAIAINREAYGDVHFVVGQNLGNLLSLQLRTGALAEAEEAGREALAIHRATLDEENPWVALDLHNLGKVLDLQGRLDEALSTLEEALAVSRAAQGDEHPETAEILFTLGRVHQARGELDRAEQLFRRYLDLRTETATGQTTAKGLTHLAEVLLAQGRREDARTLAAEAVEAARLLPPAQRWRLAVASSVEIEAAATPVIVPDAERRLLADLSTLLASDSADLRHDREALLRIARVYERWGRPQDAARYVDRARDGGSD